MLFQVYWENNIRTINILAVQLADRNKIYLFFFSLNDHINGLYWINYQIKEISSSANKFIDSYTASKFPVKSGY